MEADIAQGMILKGKGSGNFIFSTMNVHPGNEYTEIFNSGLSWYLIESKVYLFEQNKAATNEARLFSYLIGHRKKWSQMEIKVHKLKLFENWYSLDYHSKNDNSWYKRFYDEV